MRTLATAQPAGPTGTRLGEGPRWDARSGRLLWVDIESGGLHVFDPDDGSDRAIACGAMVGAVAPWDDGAVLVALADALAGVDLASGTVRRLVDLPHPVPKMRANDGACDPAGRFWIGTMRLDEAPGDSVLYRYDPDGTLHTVLTGLGMSNGIGWDPSGRRMVFIDTPTQRVDAFDYDPATGAISGRRPFAAIPPDDGAPDGLAVDGEGGVWVALHGGGRVRRYAPDGSPDAEVAVPVDEVTACAFAGRRLFITTRGGLFAADVPFSGPPAQTFAGARSTAPSDADETQAR
jgi:sugar lactone lactonase YvrE